ncbi:HD domain-containing protein [Vreelandella rituensis]|uniref:HD domain-containing protein n=1 Tax=Vreelandella rituensis TaxID=2282306 RepID=A0A368TN76_9GAMM|nr:HD domain-containing protein [Halomonas rituensis]RCV85980.1 HD domain-containing protein [Halomonas rituensis]
MTDTTPLAFNDALPPVGVDKSDVMTALQSLYQRAGNMHYGEDVTQLEHAVQCASLAQQSGASSALIVAALLHDIGHLVGPRDWRERNKHDDVGAALLERFFDDAVCQPIRLHTVAKRYLCAIEPAYEASLSEASKHSLMHQGGVMTAEECRDFEASPHFDASVMLRRWDDVGKCTELSGVAFCEFMPTIRQVLDQ